jgi:hypothetical protein
MRAERVSLDRLGPLPWGLWWGTLPNPGPVTHGLGRHSERGSRRR